MATKLKKMRLTSVDLVRSGANQEADICLFKSTTSLDAIEDPTEAETNVFKRFVAWLRNNPAETENEPRNHIEKGEELLDLEFIYKSALAESLSSIMQDETLTETEKKDMSEESLRQYAEKIQELERAEEVYDGGDDIDEKAIEEVDDFEKNDDLEDDNDTIEEEIIEEIEERHVSPHKSIEEIEEIDEIDEVEKFNPNYDRSGRFASSGGGGGTGTSPAAAAMHQFTESSDGSVHVWSPDGKKKTVQGGGGGLNSKAQDLLSSGRYDAPYKVADLVEEMKIGDTVTCKDYKKGDVMEFKKVGNANTVGAFQNVRGKNHMSSPEHVKGWVKDSIVYAKYNPTFKDGDN